MSCSFLPAPFATTNGLFRLGQPSVMAIAMLFVLSTSNSNATLIMSTNQWQLAVDETIETIAFVFAPSLEVAGKTYDDTFWLASESAHLSGRFGNDVWILSPNVIISGQLADHARIISQTLLVDGIISNGLWALGTSISMTTNSALYGEQFLFGDSLLLNGHIEGRVIGQARSITVGGTIVGDLHLKGDDILVRPGTTIVGDLYYVTTNQTIVLDAASSISGVLKKVEPPKMSVVLPPTWTAWLYVFLFLAALLVGIPFIILFPQLTGEAVQHVRFGLWRCGLVGLAVMFGMPFIMVAAAVTLIGIPLALVMMAIYGLLMYIGKFIVALAIGTAVRNRRGPISLSSALLSLVIGLILFYTAGMVPYVGSSLQTMATVFGAGSLVLAIVARRGKIRETVANKSINS